LPDPEIVFDKYPHEISGGQKQRVMIAMAIACKPQLLIADEPTTALDVTVQKEIIQLLKDIQQETGMSIIFISHDLSLVSAIAHRVVVMYQGEIVQGK
jgi:peptide/nickel transport system ATP-binding protein